MRSRLTLLAYLAAMSVAVVPSMAQSPDTVASATSPITAPLSNPLENNPDYCISIMSEFPTDDYEVRYQFFRLTEEMARDMTPNLRKALNEYGHQHTASSSSMLDAIEDIANPVLRQAAPEITVANMAYVIDFASACEPLITGQINSLKAFDAALNDTEFNAVIIEDALFLRQILSDSMHRLGVNDDPKYSASVNQYAAALVTTRDEVEFVSFETELGNLEALYLEDLDGRLKRSNDLINEEIDREVLSNSVALSDSINKAEKEKAKQRRLFTLSRILGGRR